MKKRQVTTFLVAAVVLVVITALMFCYQVRFTEKVVVTRFDDIKEDQPDGPGLHFKWPWPIEQVHRFDARLRTFETEFRQAATQDQKTVVITSYATWRIDDAEKFLTAVGREDTVTDKVRDLLENQVQLVLRKYPLSALVNTDPEKLKLDEMEQAFLEGIAGAARERYGIEFVSVGIKRLGLPESVTKDVFARMKEDRLKTSRQYEAEGQAEAVRIRSSADEMAKKIKARAEAFAKTLEGEGEAEAARYYKVFAENPQLSDFLKKLETVEKILASGQITLVLDADKFIPFDILKAAEEAGTAKDGGGADEKATAVEPDDPMGRAETRSPDEAG